MRIESGLPTPGFFDAAPRTCTDTSPPQTPSQAADGYIGPKTPQPLRVAGEARRAATALDTLMVMLERFVEQVRSAVVGTANTVSGRVVFFLENLRLIVRQAAARFVGRATDLEA